MPAHLPTPHRNTHHTSAHPHTCIRVRTRVTVWQSSRLLLHLPLLPSTIYYNNSYCYSPSPLPSQSPNQSIYPPVCATLQTQSEQPSPLPSPHRPRCCCRPSPPYRRCPSRASAPPHPLPSPWEPKPTAGGLRPDAIRHFQGQLKLVRGLPFDKLRGIPRKPCPLS